MKSFNNQHFSICSHLILLGSTMSDRNDTKIRSLAKDTGLFAISSFGSKLLIFFLTPLYTSVLTTAQYGVVDIINTTINFVYPILTLSIAEAVLRFTMDKTVSSKDVLGNAIIITIISVLLFFSIKPLLGKVDKSLNSNWHFCLAIYCLTVIHLSISSYIKGIGKTTLFALSGIIQTIVVIITNILLLIVFRLNIEGYLWSIILGSFSGKQYITFIKLSPITFLFLLNDY